jgi:hypothetical protein
VFGTGSLEHQPFGFPVGLGTNAAVYVEDCVFNYQGRNDGAIDAYGGARYAFRYNTVNNTNVEHHGADSGGYRGTLAFELYGNTFRNTSADMRKHYFRSGTGVVFNNTYSGEYTGAELTNYRSDESMAPYGLCNGSSPWDENRAGKLGYACLDQIGHVFGTGPGGANTLKPMYAWSNTHDGDPVRFIVGVSHANADIHIVENRDFYNEAAAFDGTMGVGEGVLSHRPASCTRGTAYWATDQSILYQCSSPDTWTVYYVPYTYPHPLRASSRPARPTGVTSQ